MNDKDKYAEQTIALIDRLADTLNNAQVDNPIAFSALATVLTLGAIEAGMTRVDLLAAITESVDNLYANHDYELLMEKAAKGAMQ